jgi:hypothetical protein
LAEAPDTELRVDYEEELEKSKFAKGTTKNKKEFSIKEMYQFYTNLLSADAKYMWNKIVKEQTESDLFKGLQGMSRKGPRGLLHELFHDCVMLHFLTMFPNDAAEEEKYHLSNMLKKPQFFWHTSVCTVRRAAQRLGHAATLLSQPELQSWYGTSKCSVLQG